MALRIAFDLDGTLADMESELVQQARVLFGEMKSIADSSSDGDSEQAAAETSNENASALEKLNMTPRQQRRLWKHVESIENFWLTLNELEPDVIRRLAALAAERHWEIIF